MDNQCWMLNVELIEDLCCIIDEAEKTLKREIEKVWAKGNKVQSRWDGKFAYFSLVSRGSIFREADRWSSCACDINFMIERVWVIRKFETSSRRRERIYEKFVSFLMMILIFHITLFIPFGWLERTFRTSFSIIVSCSCSEFFISHWLRLSRIPSGNCLSLNSPKKIKVVLMLLPLTLVPHRRDGCNVLGRTLKRGNKNCWIIN